MSDEKISLTQYLPYAGTGLVVLGWVRLYTYYQFFAVNIGNYLEFSEIISSFADKLVMLTFAILICLAFIRMVDRPPTKKSKSDIAFQRSNEVYETKDSPPPKLKASMTEILTLCFLFLCITGIIYVLWIAIGSVWPVILGALFWFLIMFVFGSFLFQNIKKHGILSPITLLIVYGNVIVLLIGLSIADACLVKYGKMNRNVVVHLDHETIKSHQNFYYVGKTNNFIFFYNDSTETADVYPMERVIKIETGSDTVN